MKKICFLLSSILLMTTLIFFTSCNNDDEDNGNTMDRGGSAATVDGKRLVKMVNSNDKDTIYFEYNSDGQIISSFDKKESYKENYSYVNDRIYASLSFSSSLTDYIYDLSGERIIKVTCNSSSSSSKYPKLEEEYEYDSDGYLIAIRSKISYSIESYNSKKYYKKKQSTTLTWNDGNLVSEKTISLDTTKTHKLVGYNSYKGEYLPIYSIDTFTKEINTKKEYTYTERPNVLPNFSSGTNAILGWQGYYGKSSRNMPEKVVTEDIDTYFNGYEEVSSFQRKTTTYDYTFNGNLVTKMTETINDKTDNTYSITYIWE